MKNLLFTLVLCLFTINLSAQSIESQENFALSTCETITFAQPTSDGGYMFSLDDYGENNCYNYEIVKTDAVGNIQWQQIYGGTECDYLSKILETSDGGYLLGGNSNSSDGDASSNNGLTDYWIVKINSVGIVEWEQNYGGSTLDFFCDMIATNDGGYLLTGSASSSNGDVGGNNGSYDYWAVKVNSLGTLQWEQNYGGTDSDFSHAVVQTSDGGYILGGSSRSSDGNVGGNNGDFDYWVIKINSFGTLQWEENYGGLNADSFSSLDATSDGGYILGGSSRSSNGNVSGNFGDTDYWIVKINSLGTLQWEQNYGTSGDELLLSVEEMNDGGFLLVGTYGDDIIKTNAFGTLQWSQPYADATILSGTETSDGDVCLIVDNRDCSVLVRKINDDSVLLPCPSDVRVEAEAGDVYVDESCYGLILTAPDGACFRVRVKADTTLTIDPVVCP